MEALSTFIQQSLLVLLNYDDNECHEIKDAVPLELFEHHYREIASKIYDFIDKHGEPPKDHLPDLFEDVLNNEKDAKAKRKAQHLSEILYEIHNNQAKINVTFVKKRLHNFVSHQRIMQATMQVAQAIESREVSDSKILECEKIWMDAIEKNERTRPELGRLASDIEPEDPGWLWYPYFAAGEVNLVGGRTGVGKGQLMASLAAHITMHRRWPDKSDRAAIGNVLWAEAEDSFAKTVIPRLKANAAKMERIHVFTREEFGVLNLRRYITKHKIKLIILSPLNSFLPKLRNTNDELAVRDKLQRLREAVDGTDCAIVGIVHLNKKTDLDAVERILGSVAYANFSRSVCLINYDQDGKRRLVHAVYNLSLQGNDLLFELQHVGENQRDQYVRVIWQTARENVDVASFLDRRSLNGAKPPAATWLVSYLHEHGESASEDVISTAEGEGYSRPAIRQARLRQKALVGARRDGFQGKSTWYLKKGGSLA